MTLFGKRHGASDPSSPANENLDPPSRVAISLETIFAGTADPTEIVRLDQIGELSPKLRVAALQLGVVEIAPRDPFMPEITPTTTPNKSEKFFGCKLPSGHNPIRPMSISPEMVDNIIKSGRQ